MHVFPYSERKGTRAAEMTQLPMELRRQRAAVLGKIKNELKREFLKAQAGKTLSVYFEEKENEIACGYSTNYVRVYAKDVEPGEIVDITVTKLYKEGVI